jgi:hypothetical protein
VSIEAPPHEVVERRPEAVAKTVPGVGVDAHCSGPEPASSTVSVLVNMQRLDGTRVGPVDRVVARTSTAG